MSPPRWAALCQPVITLRTSLFSEKISSHFPCPFGDTRFWKAINWCHPFSPWHYRDVYQRKGKGIKRQKPTLEICINLVFLNCCHLIVGLWLKSDGFGFFCSNHILNYSGTTIAHQICKALISKQEFNFVSFYTQVKSMFLSPPPPISKKTDSPSAKRSYYKQNWLWRSLDKNFFKRNYFAARNVFCFSFRTGLNAVNAQWWKITLLLCISLGRINPALISPLTSLGYIQIVVCLFFLHKIWRDVTWATSFPAGC